MYSLKDWKWCVDFSDSIGQKDSRINPQFFLSRNTARRFNNSVTPKGRILKVEVKVKK